jgi:hypothetical protein
LLTHVLYFLYVFARSKNCILFFWSTCCVFLFGVYCGGEGGVCLILLTDPEHKASAIAVAMEELEGVAKVTVVGRVIRGL